MDIVLEVCDTFAFDYMYAWLLPAREAPLGYPDHFATNATQKLTAWQYQPSTSWFSLEPRPAAYGSLLARDNTARQLFSFFLIFWYVPMRAGS
jgi:Delta7-sterol 5-desaturase